MIKIVLRLSCIAALLLFTSPRIAVATVSDKALQGDARLRQKVTVSSTRLYVGELLDKWSEQTGIALSASEREEADREQVAAFVKDVPLDEAMDALRSLLSHQHASWYWERTTNSAGTVGYELHQSRAARDLGVQLQAEIQKDYEAHAEAMIGALNMTEQERKELEYV